MICLGRNIKQPNDPLEKITITQLADKIRNPNLVFINFITQLRQVQAIDAKKYRELKTKLPYVVGALFNPLYRKIEHFAKANYFILDIDHVSHKEFAIEDLVVKLKKDNRILLLFKSPSGDGLKIFFKVKEPFYDHGKYTLFYKLFAQKFATDYQLDQVVDKRTSDVSRACFVSYDPDIWHNTAFESIDTQAYINFENELQLTEINTILKEHDKQQLTEKPPNLPGQDMPDDIIQQIREKLNPKLTEKREKHIYVPDELTTIIDLIRTNLLTYQIEVVEIVDIHYGKQFRLRLNHLQAEINVFYGKKGYSIVKSTKSGCNADLVDIAYDIFYTSIL